jgi:flagellar biosynthesis protein FlhF
MQLKTFTAPDVPTALRQIKEELGPDAVIVSSGRARPRRGVFGLLGGDGVEITAAFEPEAVKTRRPPARSVAPRRAAKTYAVIGEERPALATESADRESSPQARDSVMFYIRPLRDELRVLTSSMATLQAEFDRRVPRGVSELSQVRGEIAELRHMMRQMSGAASAPLTESLPRELQSMAMRLADAGVEIATIRAGLEHLAQTLTPGQLEQPEHVRECVLAELMRHISVAAPLAPLDRRARVIALVGPTGVGKTTTAAKLAGQHVAAERGAKVALITLDTFRVGAVEHLRKYAELLRAPLHVATSAAELDELVRRHLDHDLVLVDTAGGNQKDARLLADLRGLLGHNPLVETHLCVSATTKSRDLRDIAERFAPLAIEKLIFTKIDETNSGGSLYNFLTQTGRPLAFVANGQRVPEDLSVASKDAFCRWVLGE